jgi:hypothetical protein
MLEEVEAAGVDNSDSFTEQLEAVGNDRNFMVED